MGPSFGLIKVSTELLDKVPVTSVVSLGLQGLVLEHELLDLTLESVLAVLHVLLMLKFLRF